MPRFFGDDYVERVTLRDGSAALVRQVTPDDKESLRRGYAKLSAASRYSRFLTPKGELTDSELRYLTDIDGESHFALGAIRESDGEGLGIARFIRLADPVVAEAAIAVADEVHRQGLGKLLFLRLVAAAAERGIATFHCELLGTNASMQELIRQVSTDIVVSVGGGVMSIDLPLPNLQPVHEHSAPVPTNSLYGVFKLVAADALELWRRS